ncbi:glycogen/starch/alpha-glucan phosphorylase [bacterium]|nr:glycogen/starch/alpha-glucan phosphorylase [bacterium]
MQDSSLFKEWGIFHKGYSNKELKYCFANHLEYSLSKDKFTATTRDLYYSLALSVRDRMIEQWINTQQLYHRNDVKRVYYLSAEYLMGRALVNNLINLDMYKNAKKAMSDLNLDLSELAEEEAEPGLGNGGLGRLAACFLDSLATLEIPSHGYGIRYEFGIFRQVIQNMGQEEQPDAWLQLGNPWEIKRPEYNYRVKFYGELKDTTWPDGSLKTEWINTTDVIGIAYDTPIAGYDNQTVNTLRLWSSRASTEFDLDYFQDGDYLKAVEEKNISENISKVLYPNDNNFEGKELRLKQQYFFVSCSIQDILRRYMTGHRTLDKFPDKAAIQMNDTHPSLAIVELMHLLIDEQHLSWDNAWDITSRTCAYTNHTILSEALEEWPVSMFGKLLPRHLQIIFEINRRFLRRASIKHIGDNDYLKRVSIIKEGEDKKIRMSHLAIIGSHSVNGVAKLHTKLLKSTIFKDFDDLYPGRIINITNGITPRRWLLECNPNLADLVSSKIGKGWIKDLDQLKEIERFSEDPEFHKQFNDIKKRNKKVLTGITEELTGFDIDPDSIFDVQIKRIHEYKRQLMNILHIITLWLQTKDGKEKDIHPRTFIFAGKTAPNYYISKMIIKLICYAAEIINSDPADLIKVVFLPNYNVTLAERIIPASDLSEQISTAGYEASGTGNMKLALNGALTIGTLDGANIEIKDKVGKENIFIFGLKTDEVTKLRNSYSPREYYLRNPLLKRTIDLIRKGFFSPESPDLFHGLIDNLLNMDRFMVLADFDDYKRCQKEVDNSYKDRKSWTTKAILNIARMGFFSSDHTIKEYNRQIWGAKTLHVTAPERKKADNPSQEKINSSF